MFNVGITELYFLVEYMSINDLPSLIFSSPFRGRALTSIAVFLMTCSCSMLSSVLRASKALDKLRMVENYGKLRDIIILLFVTHDETFHTFAVSTIVPCMRLGVDAFDHVSLCVPLAAAQ